MRALIVLDHDVTTLEGVSPLRREALERLGVRTLRDLLFHFPRAYDDLTNVRRIAELVADELQTVHGEIVEIEGRELLKGGCLVSVVLCEPNGDCLEGIWFHQPHAAARFRMGQHVAFSGKPRWLRDYRHNRQHWQMNNPRVQPLEAGLPPDAGGIVPVYPLTADLRSDQLRPLMRQALARVGNDLSEPLPLVLLQRHGLPAVTQALHDMHFPATLEAARQARRRFAYEELLLLQVALALRRRELRDRQRAPRLQATAVIDQRIRQLFPFALTPDQDRAVAEVCRDLAQSRPMQRLLQADVGAGKTAVAVHAMLVAVACKHQAALMAPTELLAVQHHHTLERYLAHSRVRRLLLTGALTPRERQLALQRLRDGDVDLVVGTQALAQSDVRFARLGLVVIDEQHRFGVGQRASVRAAVSGAELDPHYLVMTATPIPRTVALTVFGDLDVSTIRQPPPGRQPVTTHWVPARQRDEVYGAIRTALREGRQGYVVCPLIEESAHLHSRSAVQVFEELRRGPLREFRLGLLHGRLDETAKDAVMSSFRAGQLDVLVSTSVVEVGVDVPTATLMLIEDAERFGLSQLHQLRGRVCRGAVAGECFVFADPTTPEAEERLRIFARTTDGFELAEEDARLRGSGELVGTRQHGAGELRFADPATEPDLLHLARKDAFELVTADASLSAADLAPLRRAVLERFGASLALAAVG